MNGSGTAPLGTQIGELDAEWLPGEGLWLHAPEWAGTVNRLKSMLFGWHVGSWYGEKAVKHVRGHAEGVLLPAMIAIDYMAAPMPVRLLEYSWSPRAAVIRRAAAWIHHAVRAGWYAPDLLGWSQRQRTWKVAIPDQAAGAAEQWKQLRRDAEACGTMDLDSWLSDAIEEIAAQDAEAADALRLLLLRSGADLSAMAASDEGDWLIAIGWTPDDTPFRIALQLIEPTTSADAKEGKGWRLAAVLRGRTEQDMTLRLGCGEDGRWKLEDGAASVPVTWLPWLGSKLQREQAKWLSVLPELKDLPHEQAEAESDSAAAVDSQPDLGLAGIRLAISEQEAWHILQEGSVRLLQAGCPVILPGWWEAARTRRLRIKAKVKTSVGASEEPMFGLDQIVQFDWKLAVGDIDLSEAEFSKLAADNRRLLHIGGEWVHLDPGDVKLIRDWMKKRGKSKGLSFRDVLEWHLRGGIALGEDEEDPTAGPLAHIELNDHLTAWLERLQNIGAIPPVEKPAGFLGELRPYQLEGISWLAFLRQFGLGGCLADDMGLGKTIQYTGYLLHVKAQEGGSSMPSLLICPTSVIGNWEKELERFAPELNVYLHYGPRRVKGEAFASAVQGADIVITSYALTPLDEEELSGVMWNSLCLDEAQNIKNVYTKQTAAIRRLHGRHRIALTGTPMENRLTELWSIHDFINPGYLGTLGEFRREVVLPIEKSRDEKQIAQLQQWVKPFMLRRLKKDPAIQLALPEKNEQRMFVSLTAEQAALYEQTVSELLDGLGDLTPMKRRGLILAALTKLKQLCDHPLLLLGEGTRGAGSWQTERSGKLVRLLEMVDEIAAEGERCLIFTQFIGAGELIKAKLEKRLGMPVPYLHGGVAKADRDAMIAAFQDPGQPACAFVLSLKAGGTGLNLTAANHVFHFDRWWNPAVENQATDRAFRIGQTKNVQVHKFVTIGTLEERIDDMITRKHALSEQVVGQSEGWITELDQDELRALFTLRKSWAHS